VRDRNARDAPKRSRRSHARDQRQRGALWFVVRFFACWLGSIVLLWSAPGIENWSVQATLASLKAALALFTGSAYVNGTIVGTGALQFGIISDCTPVMPLALFCSACLAFPTGWRWKVVGMLGAAVLLWIYNLIRVLLMFVVMTRWPSAFDFFHVYLWQTTTLIVVFLLFTIWLRMQRASGTQPSGAEGLAVPSSSGAGR
jgi:exosortase/archaeosortase family protein